MRKIDIAAIEAVQQMQNPSTTMQSGWVIEGSPAGCGDSVQVTSSRMLRPPRPNSQEQTLPATRRPNIILSLVNDMGFADLGAMGSEIGTPQFNGKARQVIFLSAMYNCARCRPTRASLLTGLYPHKAGRRR